MNLIVKKRLKSFSFGKKKPSQFESSILGLSGECVCVAWGHNIVTGNLTVHGDQVRVLSSLNEVVLIRMKDISSFVLIEKQGHTGDDLALLENMYYETHEAGDSYDQDDDEPDN